MKDAAEFFYVLIGLIALLMFFYILENTSRLSAIADKTLDRIEAAVSAPETTIHKQQDRVSIPCPDQGEGS